MLLRKTSVAMLAVAAACLLGTATAHAGFHAVGGTLNIDGTRDAPNTSIADVGGVPYVAWRETTGILGGLIFVKRFDGTNWVQVGDALNFDITQFGSVPSITSLDGVPYVAWEESTPTKFQIRVARFNGTSWEPVGGSLNTDTNQAGTQPNIATIGGVPYVGWSESISTVNREQVHVRRLNSNGTTWDLVGTALNFDTSKPGRIPRIADIGGVPYVTWFEGISPDPQQVYVRRLNSNGTTWDLVGAGSLNIQGTEDALDSSIANIGGVPYVAWLETGETVEEAHAKRFDGSDWVPVGGALNTPGKTATSTPEITSVAGVPYATWSEGAFGTTPQVVVKRFDGSNWVAIGGTSNPDPGRAGLDPAVANVGGLPYVAWIDKKGADGKIRVTRQLRPTCTEASLNVARGASTTIPLSCLDATALAIAGNPGHGTLSTINQVAGTVTYTPGAGYSGADSFGFRGSEGPLESSVATVALTVGSPTAVAALSKLGISPRAFPAAGRGPSATRKRVRRTGAKVSYRDSQAATTTFTVLKPRRGVRRGRKCVKAGHGRRGKRCTRYVAVGSFTHRDRAGANSFHFTGRARGRKLAPGSYRLRAVPRLAGRKGRAVTTRFRIVR